MRPILYLLFASLLALAACSDTSGSASGAGTADSGHARIKMAVPF